MSVLQEKAIKSRGGWRKEVPVAPLCRCMVPPRLDPVHHLWGGECIFPSSLNYHSVLISQALAPLCGPLGWLFLTLDLPRLHPSVNLASRHTRLQHGVHFFVTKLRSSAGRSCKQCSVMLFFHTLYPHAHAKGITNSFLHFSPSFEACSLL